MQIQIRKHSHYDLTIHSIGQSPVSRNYVWEILFVNSLDLPSLL